MGKRRTSSVIRILDVFKSWTSLIVGHFKSLGITLLASIHIREGVLGPFSDVHLKALPQTSLTLSTSSLGITVDFLVSHRARGGNLFDGSHLLACQLECHDCMSGPWLHDLNMDPLRVRCNGVG